MDSMTNEVLRAARVLQTYLLTATRRDTDLRDTVTVVRCSYACGTA